MVFTIGTLLTGITAAAPYILGLLGLGATYHAGTALTEVIKELGNETKSNEKETTLKVDENKTTQEEKTTSNKKTFTLPGQPVEIEKQESSTPNMPIALNPNQSIIDTGLTSAINAPKPGKTITKINTTNTENISMPDQKTQIVQEGAKEETMPTIKDTTDENIIHQINPEPTEPVTTTKEEQPQETETQNNTLDYSQVIKDRDERWAREDAIRAETQAREDNAYQRAVQDMIKAGINPNLVGVSPASSGGGITQATGKDYTPSQMDLQKYLTEFETYLDQEFNANENQKDRIMNYFSKIIPLLLLTMR